MQQAVTLSRPIDGLRRTAAQLKVRAGKLWRAYPRETVGVGLLSLTVAAAVGGTALTIGNAPSSLPQTAPPAPPPLLIRQLAPAQALQVNKDIPLASGPNPAAQPFVF